ncbi:unnamed protein product [Haemonchus placei]|uniref:Uncharacterized protein n=1 Tax=Haemonchus placei TaxID=6290 RepID=A0A3P7YHV3_HAEPC|nr:unnamed protein product [Haemonchus placei]
MPLRYRQGWKGLHSHLGETRQIGAQARARGVKKTLSIKHSE